MEAPLCVFELFCATEQIHFQKIFQQSNLTAVMQMDK